MYKGTYYENGWFIYSGAASTYTDFDGFTACKVESTSTYHFDCISNIIKVIPGETYTLSFDVKILKRPSVNVLGNLRGFLASTIEDIDSSTNYTGAGFNDQSFAAYGLSPGDMEIDKWYRANRQIVIPPDVHFMSLALGSYGDASNHFRLPSAYHGAIKNSTWLMSPFDIKTIF